MNVTSVLEFTGGVHVLHSYSLYIVALTRIQTHRHTHTHTHTQTHTHTGTHTQAHTHRHTHTHRQQMNTTK